MGPAEDRAEDHVHDTIAGKDIFPDSFVDLTGNILCDEIGAAGTAAGPQRDRDRKSLAQTTEQNVQCLIRNEWFEMKHFQEQGYQCKLQTA